jgi:hypothetical protein
MTFFPESLLFHSAVEAVETNPQCKINFKYYASIYCQISQVVSF